MNVLLLLSSSFQNKKEETYPLTVKVKDLRNENGVVQFALYNTNGSIPDEELKLVARALLPAEIVEGCKLHYELMQYTII